MASKVISIRFDEDEFGALEQLADAEGVDFGEYVRRKVRLGVAADIAADQHALAEQRRDVDRELAKKQFHLVAQCVLVMQELAEKNGLDLDAIKNDAILYTEESYARSDALEEVVAEGVAAMTGQQG